MSSKADKPNLELVASEELDEDEKEFLAIRRDLPGVSGANDAGIVSISVGKTPPKNAYFRTHPDFFTVIGIVDEEVGMERKYLAVAPTMDAALHAIGIMVADHALYLTVTDKGVIRIVPVRLAGPDTEQNEYNRTRQIILEEAKDKWLRLYADTKNKVYERFPAPVGRFGEPKFPLLKPSKIMRLCFRDKGLLIDSTEHAYYLRLAARDNDK